MCVHKMQFSEALGMMYMKIYKHAHLTMNTKIAICPHTTCTSISAVDESRIPVSRPKASSPGRKKITARYPKIKFYRELIIMNGGNIRLRMTLKLNVGRLCLASEIWRKHSAPYDAKTKCRVFVFSVGNEWRKHSAPYDAKNKCRMFAFMFGNDLR